MLFSDVGPDLYGRIAMNAFSRCQEKMSCSYAAMAYMQQIDFQGKRQWLAKEVASVSFGDD